MTKGDLKDYSAPCGIFCGACPQLKDMFSCRGCRLDSRHDNCEIYDCCVVMGGMEFCYECECFPCERLREFVNFNPGKNFAHFRHIAIENLKRMREVGCEQWAQEMHDKLLAGTYTILKRDSSGQLDNSPCSCVKKKKEKNR